MKTAGETARYDNDVPKTIDIDRAGKMVEKYAVEGWEGGKDGREVEEKKRSVAEDDKKREKEGG